jgi:hypothetical protein
MFRAGLPMMGDEVRISFSVLLRFGVRFHYAIYCSTVLVYVCSFLSVALL